jgi:hydroxylamine reductase (hybrid-cluster protein)
VLKTESFLSLNTRFHTLVSATERILEMFEGLKSYICLQQRCRTVTEKFLRIIWKNVLVICDQHNFINHIILKTEKTTAVVTQVARELKEGKQGYEDRRDNYTLQEAIMLLKELEETKNNNP